VAALNVPSEYFVFAIISNCPVASTGHVQLAQLPTKAPGFPHAETANHLLFCKNSCTRNVTGKEILIDPDRKGRLPEMLTLPRHSKYGRGI
jgi:hypothetical protein